MYKDGGWPSHSVMSCREIEKVDGGMDGRREGSRSGPSPIWHGSRGNHARLTA